MRRMNERYYSYDLFNTATEQVEATERKTADEVRRLNHILRANGEPQRWIATPWANYYTSTGWQIHPQEV